MHRILFITIFSTFIFSACSEHNPTSKHSSTNNIQSNSSDSITQHDEKERITKKYGEQWDFCDCVQKNDSIDKLLKNQKLSDSELDNLLRRAEEIEIKCKLLLIDLKSNKPSDRLRHQEKVKACLEN